MRCLKQGRFKFVIVMALINTVIWTFIMPHPTITTTGLYNTNRDYNMQLNTVQDRITWMDAIHLAGTIRAKPGALTIGIPTVYRPKESYLHTTLVSLRNAMTTKERESVICIVFLSGSNSTYASELALNLTATFPEELRRGFIRLITAPPEYYPSMDHLKITFNDKIERVKWRSRQNLDYAFLVNYAKNLSTYYLQIEDDVMASAGFVGNIFDFVHKQKKAWAVLDFSGHGFIGKLFKSADLPKLALILRVFFNEQPCDFLINYFRGLLVQPKSIVRKPPLFKHIGHYSTLKDQVRKIGFGAIGKNPEAFLDTTIKTYSTFNLERVYEGLNRFWGIAPKTGDTIDINFVDSQDSIKRIIVETGNLKLPSSDTLQSGVLEYSKGSSKKCHHFVPLEKFANGRLDFNSTGVKAIKCLRIRITESQKEWLMIRKIQIKT